MSETREEEHIEKQRSQCLRWGNKSDLKKWRAIHFQPRKPPAKPNDGGLARFLATLFLAKVHKGGGRKGIHILSKGQFGLSVRVPS